MTRARSQHGFTLVELLVSMTLGVVVLGAVLQTFTSAEQRTRATRLRIDAQDRLRTTAAAISRDVRNQVSSTSPQASFERRLPYDMVFQTYDRAPSGSNTTGLARARYCLDAPAGRLLLQRQTWTTAGVPPVPAGTACPADGWTSTTVLAAGVTNRAGGLDRPLFTYTLADDNGVLTGTALDLSLWLAVDPVRGTELRHRTSLSLRNANRPPTAGFTVTQSGRDLVLNASPSLDPDGQPLRFAWIVNGVEIGSISRIETRLPTSGTHTILLRVIDSGDMVAERTQTVVAP